MLTDRERNDRIRQAVSTSFLSKGGTLLVQFIALPIAARELGSEMFGVFAAMSAIAAFFSFADLGIGPALGHKIALGAVKGDKSLQARYF